MEKLFQVEIHGPGAGQARMIRHGGYPLAIPVSGDSRDILVVHVYRTAGCFAGS